MSKALPMSKAANSQNLRASKRERLLQRLSQRIEQFTPKLLRISEIAKGICDGTTSQLGFDFAAVQLVDFESRCIQTVYGTGFSGEWHKISKHSLEGDPKFLDIQADITLAFPPRLEIITGWDPRFDEFIYREFGHRHYTRIWAPLIVARDKHRHLIEAHPKQFGFERITSGRSRIIQLSPKAPLMAAKHSFEIIGTLEAGFDNWGYTEIREISDDLARAFFKKACQSAEDLYHTTLLHVLELVTDSIKQLTRADYASLHFPLDTHGNRFAYNIWLGSPSSRELQPRKGGIGEQAINAGKPKTILYGRNTSRRFNRAVHAAGINSYTAFPLIFGGGQRPALIAQPSEISDAPLTGVLNIAFKHVRRFTRSEIKGLQPFVTLALDAIRNVTYHTQALNSTKRLESLHDISKFFADEVDVQHLLRSIAGDTLNILAADLVFIYVYNVTENCFDSLPATAGRRQSQNDEYVGPAGIYMPPAQLIFQGESTYAESREQIIDLYADKEDRNSAMHFVTEEGIESAASILLKLGREVIGVLLVNYRHAHVFSKDERKFVETLASTAAIAISKRQEEFKEDRIRAHAVKEVCEVILHELGKKVGHLERHAAKEVPAYKGSAVKVRLDRVKRLLMAIRGLYRATAATPESCEFNLAELVHSIADEEVEEKGLDIALIGSATMRTQADPDLLRLTICNGLRNAIEAASSTANDEGRCKVIIDWGATGIET